MLDSVFQVIALINARKQYCSWLAAACPNTDPLGVASRKYHAITLDMLGTTVLDGACYGEAMDHFTTAVKSTAFSSNVMSQTCEDLVMAFLSAGESDENLEADQYVMNAVDETAKSSCFDWSNAHSQPITATAPPHHATAPVVDVPFTNAKERNAATGVPGNVPDIVPDEYLDTTQPDPDMQRQQRQQTVAVHIDPGEHGGGKSCVCC
ncbi:uncharacterized protein F5891DRAFT_1258604 [Suillus fuscotomentosus]|uniref:Uncharacterized protein n=1 Tax=Suillus fuscotomentosus TaxID=1912939 RepID=A0AAD4HFH1_9AGAM|nr:uncharacterized protein F5891DRAFT_1258604 [Suillus fuscotomentosus]KAG1893564.1 hypothetical protein F5891DRAFT_1258604 [Suillus fuscotomentosus]